MAEATLTARKLVRSMTHKGNLVPCPKITFLVDEPDGIVCLICQDSKLTFRSNNGEHDDCTPAMLPCGHVFGLECLRIWSDVTEKPVCPCCRVPMWYKGCEHKIQPKPVDRATIHWIPDTIPVGGQSVVPHKCGLCQMKKRREKEQDKWEKTRTKFLRARARYIKTGSEADRAALLTVKNYIESEFGQIFYKDAVEKVRNSW